MTEQLRFEQRFGDGGAVDGHERLVRRRAGVVNSARKQLFARAGFSDQQHGGPAGGGDAARELYSLAKGGTASDDIRKTKGAGVGRGVSGSECQRLASRLRLAVRERRSEERLCSPP